MTTPLVASVGRVLGAAADLVAHSHKDAFDCIDGITCIRKKGGVGEMKLLPVRGLEDVDGDEEELCHEGTQRASGHVGGLVRPRQVNRKATF